MLASEVISMSQAKPIIKGSRLQKILSQVLDKLNAGEAPIFLVSKRYAPSPRDKALRQKAKTVDELHEIIPRPGVFQASYGEVMAEQGIILSGDYKVIVSALFGIETDNAGNIIPYPWQEGDTLLFKDVKWRVYNVKNPALDATPVVTILMIRKQAGEGYTPEQP